MSDNSGNFNLADYVEVHERIQKFYEQHPDGSLQGDYHLTEVDGESFVVYKALAYRSSEDQRPGVGFAWEPFPGKTTFTKDSELMNAETSAWGRAIASLGFEVHKGIASRQEVQNRGGGGRVPATEKQVNYLAQLAKDAGADAEQQESIRLLAAEKLSRGNVSEAIGKLKKGDEDVKAAVLERLIERAEYVPSDVQAELPHEPEPTPEEEETEAPF